MRKIVLALVLTLPLAACGGRHPHAAVSDSEVSSLSPDERSGIDAARAEVTQATQAQSQARADIEVEKRQVDVASQEVKRAKAELAISETNMKSATEGQNSDEMISAKQRREHAHATLDYQKTELSHQESELDLGRAKLNEAGAWEYYARSKVELEKARALTKKLGDASPDAQAKLAKAEQQAAGANLKHANARGATQKAQKRAEKLRAESDTLKAAIPQSGGVSSNGSGPVQ